MLINNKANTATMIAAAVALAACGQNAPPSNTTGTNNVSGASTAPTMPIIALPDPDSAAAKVFTAKCGECHAIPAPTAHLAAEWPSVVYRMQSRRIAKGKGALTDPEFKVILEYLVAHARS